jgi:N6-L-threonylcarbamoyladenine synthase
LFYFKNEFFRRKYLILSIESSCDDSSIAITEIETKKIVFHKKISQALSHSNYGGVVPELASRLHTEALPKILEETVAFLPKIKAIAVTNRPGLVVTLLEGVTMAKALSISLKIPLIGVDHLKGHIYSLFIEKKEKLPLLVLLVSGGHTQLIEVKTWNNFKVIATTLDDSLGESFDKVSKMLGLGYPGGSIIENLAKDGNEDQYNFPVPLSQSPKIAFSYSGLKNSVRLQIEKGDKNNIQFQRDISASFQKVATAHLIQKLKKYLKKSGSRFQYFGVVGGVSANQYITGKLSEVSKSFGMEILYPKMEFTSDNGAMIGRYGIELFKNSIFTDIQSLQISSKSEIN